MPGWGSCGAAFSLADSGDLLLVAGCTRETLARVDASQALTALAQATAKPVLAAALLKSPSAAAKERRAPALRWSQTRGSAIDGAEVTVNTVEPDEDNGTYIRFVARGNVRFLATMFDITGQRLCIKGAPVRV